MGIKKENKCRIKLLNNMANTEEETVTISKKEYESLKDDSFKLECLEGGGVDNWEGYDFAMEEYWKAQES